MISPGRRVSAQSLAQTFALTLALTLAAGCAAAGPIESACNRSDRDAASRNLCACLQSVADMTLRGADQRRAARFFANPELAHKTWMSQSKADDAFWDRYQGFADQAAAYCAPAVG